VKYSIKVTNIEGKINLIKVLRTLEPGLALVDAKNLVWEKEIVDLSKIRQERRYPAKYIDDFVFSQAEYEFINRELDGVANLVVEKGESDLSVIEEAFRAGFEAGIASDDDVETALEKFLERLNNVE
jgi:hypothetical protein